MNIQIAAALGIVVVILSLTVGVHHYRSEYVRVSSEYDGYKKVVEAQGKQAIAESKLQETKNETKIELATRSRDDALKQLRIAQAAANAAGRRMPEAPRAPAGSKTVCFDADKYNTAFSKYRERLTGSMEGLRGLAIEGDRAQIDAKSLLEAWPK